MATVRWCRDAGATDASSPVPVLSEMGTESVWHRPRIENAVRYSEAAQQVIGSAVRAGGLGCQWSDRLCRVGDVAVFALGGEEVGPRHHPGVLLEEGTALAFGHPAPDTEFDVVVERIGGALEDHRAVPADHRGFSLGGAAHEQFVWVAGATAGFGHPRVAGLGRG
jgi:hypothetical protein